MNRWSTPLIIAALAFALTAPAGAAEADPAAGALPSPALQPAPELAPPILPRRPRPPAPGVPAPPSRSPAGEPPDRAVFLRADTLVSEEGERVQAIGNAELRTRRETLLGDWLQYDLETDEIWGKGNVLLRRGFDWITGPEARFLRDKETGFFAKPRYFLGENGGRGTAEELRFVGPQRFEATDARYTTCVASREDWYLRMSELEVDQSRKIGTGHHATLYFLGTPIAYTPWFEFPLSDERKSGFLTPILGSTGTRGLEIALPYYFNLAPNYDLTLTPRLMTKRGLQVGAQGRYLFDTFTGELNLEDLPNDRATGKNRYAMSWKHNQNLDKLTPGLAGFLNLNKVSDDTYFADLSDRIAITSQTTLPREGGLAYSRGPWQFLAREQSFQTLQDPTAPPVGIPYNRIPQLLSTLRDVDWGGITFAGAGEYVRFSHPTLPTGQRVYAYPAATWASQGAAWFLRARTGLHARHYDLDQVTAASARTAFAIPVTSLDAGVVFERDWNLLGQDVVQTLEPRAYYVYVPYRDQSGVPAFDTAIDDYNFGQLFTENRYLGQDRVGDANQLTLALTSRLVDPRNGAERLRLAIGQRYYFADQRVVLNEVPRSASSSDILIQADGRLSDAWAFSSLMQYNFDSSQSERFDAGFRYTPAPGKAFTASYRFNRHNLDPTAINPQVKQFDLAGQWPVNPQWTVLGRWNYSLADRKTLEGVAGLEYNADCWVLRIVAQRLATTSQTTTTSVYLQVELSGMARFGTSPLELLRRTVPRYLPSNDPALNPQLRGEPFPEF